MSKRSFDQETINQIIDLYNKGLGVNEVGKQLRIAGGTCSRVLKENGVVLRKPGLQKTSPEIEARIIDLYQQGNSYKKVGSLVGLNHQTCKLIIDRNNVHSRTIQETNREYFFNERIFENIDTEEKAYWLGFISADGTVVNETYKKSVGFGLQLDDKEHLVKFNSFLGCNQPIREELNRGFGKGKFYSCHITVVSTTLVKDLISHLKEPKKGKRNWYYEEINPELERHYFRGLFDGDGGLTYADYPVLTMCGNKTIVTRFHEICKSLGSGLKVNLQEKQSISDYVNLNSIHINGRQVLPVVEYLYKNSNIFLNRKKHLADLILNNCYKD